MPLRPRYRPHSYIDPLSLKGVPNSHHRSFQSSPERFSAIVQFRLDLRSTQEKLSSSENKWSKASAHRCFTILYDTTFDCTILYYTIPYRTILYHYYDYTILLLYCTILY